MNQVWSTILSIILILIILGVLVSIHEAGHLFVAKLFNVYCFEYSIGFGPKILKKKRKAGETFFSIGVVPFGGYVAMYGESESVPDGIEVPPIERSIEGIAKWKKALILVAGVFLNFVLGLILIFISVSCFPQYYTMYGNSVTVTPEMSAPVNFVKPTYSGELASFIEGNLEEGYAVDDALLTFPAATNYGYYVSDETVLFNADGTYYNVTLEASRYVAVFMPNDIIDAHDLTSSLLFYPVKRELGLGESYTGVRYAFWTGTEGEQIEALHFDNIADGSYFTYEPFIVPIHSQDIKNNEIYTQRFFNNRIDFSAKPAKLTFKNHALQDSGILLPVIKDWNNWSQIWQKFGERVPSACTMIVDGFISLFKPGGFNNISGIIGMTAAVPTIVRSGGAAQVFWFAAVISINLCFFNLLPFPGLDGWGLVVTAFEAITKKKISSKVKGIVSFIGLALLFLLMIAVAFKDVFAMIGR